MRTPLVVPIAVGTFFGAVSTRLPVGDSDVFWHLVLGKALLARGLGQVDTYSWTAAGRPESVDQWLGQVIWAVAGAGAPFGDWTGISWVRGLAVALLVGLIVYAALRERPARPLGAVLAALPAIALSRFVWTERPELFGFVCLAALVPILRAARAGSDRALFWIPPLVVLWANLHGSFALGAVLVVLVAVEGAVAQPTRRRRYAAAAIGTVIATLVTPAGLGAWTAPGFHLLHPPREIQEWSVPDVTTLPGAVFAVAIFATALTGLFSRRHALSDAVVLLPVLFVSLIATRQMPLFAIAAVPYLAAHGGEAVTALASQVGLRGPAVAAAMRLPSRTVDLAALAVALLVLTVAGVTGTHEPDLRGYPPPEIRSQLRAGPGLLNEYDWGGFLIAAAPATPVFVDGRLIPYLGAVMDDYTTVVGVHPGWRDVIARRGIHEILVRPSDPVAVRARDLGWPIRASSDTFVLIDVP
ncbi:MAG TPA: hypothetical protein VGT60_08135 [Candidatus Limnocylindria bacterium]|nr:hypothetical protein [Candidatus Limnocylindria bacterium]